MDIFTGCRIKLARARHHMDSAYACMRDYVEVKLSNTADDTQVQMAEGWQTLRWNNVPPVPPMVSAVFGDFINNVRSALDSAVWALVRANGGTTGNHTVFPIYEFENQWLSNITNWDGKGKQPPTSGLSAEALQLVHDAQPFTAGKKSGKRTTMYRLWRCSNEDKHRMLHATGIVPATDIDISFTPEGYIVIDGIEHPPNGTRIIKGAEIARINLRFAEVPPDEVIVHVNRTQGITCEFFGTAPDFPRVLAGDLPKILNLGTDFIQKASRLPEAKNV